MSDQTQPLWIPSQSRIEQANLMAFMSWLAERDHSFGDYESLRAWSVAEPDEFWRHLAGYFELSEQANAAQVKNGTSMPAIKWFEGTSINFARYLLVQGDDTSIAIKARGELGEVQQLTWAQLRSAVIQTARAFQAMGVKAGDRVAAYLPNVPATAIAYLGATSIGAIWSSCAPEFGFKSVVDRFSQIDPTILLVTDSYRFAGKVFDRTEQVAEIVSALSGLKQVIHVAGPNAESEHSDEPNSFAKRLATQAATLPASSVTQWSDFLASGESDAPFEFPQLDFNHPLWVVYSSGTTGLPKPFVHSHGGVLLEALKFMHFHMDLKPDSSLFYYTTTGWVMWNILVNGLLSGGSIVMYDGAPMLPDQPDVLWELTEQTGITFFGASPTYIAEQAKRNIHPSQTHNVTSIDSILLGGSPATPEHMQWCLDELHDDIWVTSQSGGTDVASGFVGGSPLLPVYGGEIQCRCLGVDVQSLDDAGNAQVNQVGELVVCQPMPSMPLKFWNDEHFERYQAAYFEDYPGLWRHGDYFLVNERGGCLILGRSDSTLNRYGVRIGTAEIYRSLDTMAEIDDALIVNLDLPEGKFFMPLFVKLAAGVVLTSDLKESINDLLRRDYSPRHVPDAIIAMPDIPYTLTGKKMEVPVRKLLLGLPIDRALSRDAMANPEALEPYLKVRDSKADGAYSL